MPRAFACLSLAALFMMRSTLAADEQELKDQLATLQGSWRITALETDGKPGELPEVSFWWFIKGDKVRYGGKDLATLTLDAKANPRCIDLKFKNPERVYEGIYAIEGDNLKICLNRRTQGIKERPAEFSTRDKLDWSMLLFKRDKNRRSDDLEGLGGFANMAIRIREGDKALVIMDVPKDGPAMKAGVKKNDVLLKVNGLEAADLLSVIKRIRALPPGSDLNLHLKRGDKEQDVTVKLAVLPFMLFD